jgi:hypothetical protein
MNPFRTYRLARLLAPYSGTRRASLIRLSRLMSGGAR